jgi:hypothetical protein
VVALRLAPEGRPQSWSLSPDELSPEEFRRWTLRDSWSGSFTPDGRIRFTQKPPPSDVFDEQFRLVARPDEPFLRGFDRVMNDLSTASWRQVEENARPGPGLSGSLVLTRSQGGRISEGWFYDPRHQCLVGLDAARGEPLGFVGSHGFADSPVTAGPLGSFRNCGAVYSRLGGTLLLLWQGATGLYAIDATSRRTVQLTTQELIPLWVAGLGEPLSGGPWVATVGAIHPGGIWILLGLRANGESRVWRGDVEGTYSQFLTDGTSLFLAQGDCDLSTSPYLPQPEWEAWLRAKTAKPWHSWRSLHRIDANGPVQVARHDWDVEGIPPQPQPTGPPPPAPGFRAELDRALQAATVPAALAPFALWCRRLVPEATPTTFRRERYQPPLERFGRRFGWAYPVNAWHVPWGVLFVVGVLLHARKRGAPSRLALSWSIAAAAFGLAGVLAYFITRPTAPRPCPGSEPEVLPMLRDPQEAA